MLCCFGKSRCRSSYPAGPEAAVVKIGPRNKSYLCCRLIALNVSFFMGLPHSLHFHEWAIGVGGWVANDRAPCKRKYTPNNVTRQFLNHKLDLLPATILLSSKVRIPAPFE